MKAIKRFYVYYQHHLAGKTTVWARKPSFASQRERGRVRERGRGRAQQRPLFFGVQFRYGRHLKRTSSSSFRLPRKNDSERERGRGSEEEEADTYQWTGIAGAQKTSDVAIGHVNLLLDYLLSLPLSPSFYELWQCISITRTSELAADACDSCPKTKRFTTSLQHVPLSAATKLEGGKEEKGRPSWAEAPLCG